MVYPKRPGRLETYQYHGYGQLGSQRVQVLDGLFERADGTVKPASDLHVLSGKDYHTQLSLD